LYLYDIPFFGFFLWKKETAPTKLRKQKGKNRSISTKGAKWYQTTIYFLYIKIPFDPLSPLGKAEKDYLSNKKNEVGK